MPVKRYHQLGVTGVEAVMAVCKLFLLTGPVVWAPDRFAFLCVDAVRTKVLFLHSGYMIMLIINYLSWNP